MKGKKLVALIMAVALLLGAVPSALADPPAKGDGAATEYTGNLTTEGGTTVGVVAVKEATAQVSFSVPLYATLAVVGAPEETATGGTVYAPAKASYKITNTSDSESTDIGVTAITVNGVAGGTWAIADAAAGATTMKLTLGGVQVPTIAAGVSAVPVEFANIWATGSSFASETENGKPKIITPNTSATGDHSIEIEFVGEVSNTWKNDAVEIAATPQWVFMYTVAKMNQDGREIVAFTYSGNEQYYVWDGQNFTTEGAFARAV